MGKENAARPLATTALMTAQSPKLPPCQRD